MKTFNKFVEEMGFQNKLVETATLMVEKGVEPAQFLQTWYENNEPELFLILNEVGFWKNVWNGVQKGAQEFSANRAFDTAIQSLTSLTQHMQNSPQAAKYARVVDNINRINKSLGILKHQAINGQSNMNQPQQGNQPQAQQPQQTQQPDPFQRGLQQQAQQQRMGFPASM